MLKLRNRVVVLFVLLCVMMSAMVVRLGYIHIIWADELAEHAKKQQNKAIPIRAKRGDIVDRNGNKLAFSVSTYTVWAHTKEITLPQETAELLAATIDVDATEVATKIKEKKTSIVKVASGITKTDADLVRGKGIRGLSIEEETKRIYPYGDLAAHVIGNVYADQNGFLGLEFFYNDMLSGVPGVNYVTTDVYGRQLAHGTEETVPPTNGTDLMLTIDNTIQYFVEQRLKEAAEVYEPKSASAIIMDPRNGEIVAMASYPSFNLNDIRTPREGDEAAWEKLTVDERSEYLNNMWRNHMISDIYEPGSVMKVLTAAIAIEEGLVGVNDRFFCNGYKVVDGVKLKCSSYDRGGHGDQNFMEAFANSCNPAFIEIAQKIGPETYYAYYDKLGIPGKTGIDLPSEGAGLLIDKDAITNVDFATMSYGHGTSLTMVQVANLVSTLVHNGDIIAPHVVKGYYKDGAPLSTYQPQVVKSVFSGETVKLIRTFMTAAVDKSYKRTVKVPGLSVGGKTGTSTKIVDGKYNNEYVIASFAGAFPMEDPEYVIYVTVDEPKKDYFGSIVAAPIGRSIIDDILRYKNIVPEVSDIKTVKVPDLKGLSLKEAVAKLEALGLNYATDPLIVEEGVAYNVIDQYPKADIAVDKGTSIILSLEEE
ncbi:penicillin-binding transpeptidase domain-containing protein [Fusibacter sp. JL298sf-3]